jgi:hypothetical protein
MIELPAAQAAILTYMYHEAPVTGEAQLLQFTLDETNDPFYAAAILLRPLQGLELCSLVMTLGSYAPRIFFAVTQTRAFPLARMLANLEDLERQMGALEAGHIVNFEGGDEEWNDYTAALLLPPNAMGGFAAFPEEHRFRDARFTFSLVTPLTRDEIAFRESQGHEALLQRMTEQRRDIVAFRD